MSLKVWAFKHHVCLINGKQITGFGTGDDVISAEQREDTVSDVVGAGGDMMASVSSNESAEIKIKLLSTSSDNAYLHGLHEAFKSGLVDGVIQITIANTKTGETDVSTSGYIKKLPARKIGTKGPEKEWSIVVPKLISTPSVK